MTIAMNVEKEHGQHAVNLSLLKVGPIVQATLAAIITVIVLLATATTVTVVVSRSSYQPPIPADDRAVTYKTTPVAIYVLSNDVDPRNENLTVGGIVKQPLFGKAEVVNDRFILYTPAKRYAGDVEFEYICKNSKEQATAKVVVTVENHPPEPIDFKFSIDKNSEGNPKKIFTEKDERHNMIRDLDDDPLRIVNITAPQNGTAWFDDDTLYYTPNKEFNGMDSITYTITDDNHTASAVVHYRVFNSPPKANPDYFIVTMNNASYLDVLANDEDINGDELFIDAESELGYHGQCSAIITADRKLVKYVPTIGLHGITESFEYTVSDGFLKSSSYAIIKIINTPPEAGDYVVEVKKNTEDNHIPLKYSDKDPGTTLTIEIIKEPSNGNYSLTHVTKQKQFIIDPEQEFDEYDYDWHEYSLVYTPESGDIFDDYMEYEVTDNAGDKAIGRITIKVTNTPPVAVDDIIDGLNQNEPCQKNGHIDIRVLDNDYDPNGDQIFLYSADSSSKYGGTIRADVGTGIIRYVAPIHFVGVDEFTYTIKDVHDAVSKPATVFVTVVNSPPEAHDDEFKCSKGHTCQFDVLLNDFDINSDILTIANFTDPLQGGIARNTTILDSQKRPKDAIEYETQNTVYTDIMTYTITDGEFEDTANVKITVFNEPPVPYDDYATTHWNTSVEINVVENDKDNNPGDEEKLVVDDIIKQPDHGEVYYDGKIVVYIPKYGFIGIDTFTYTVRDDFDTSEKAATVTVNVTNNAPVAMPDEFIMHWRETSVLDVTANDYDPDNDEFYLKDVITTFSGSGNALIENGKIVYTPPAVKGPVSFKYIISDYSPQEGVGEVTVNLENNAPEALDDEISRHWRDFTDGFIINVKENDRDADLDPISISSLYKAGTEGTVVIDDANVGTVKYTFTKAFSTASFSDSFEYTITDSVEEDTAKVSITITNEDRPTAEDAYRKIHWTTQETGTLVEVVGSLRDTDNDELTVNIVVPPPNGEAEVVQQNGKQYIKYTQNKNYKGLDSVTYTISDGLASAQATITFEIYNNVPTAKDFAYDLPYEDRDIGIAVDVIGAANDEDPEDRSDLKISAVSEPNEGSITSGLNNPIVYTAPDNWLGPETFTYTITDGLDTVTKSITINTLPQIAGNHTKRYTIHWSTQTTGSTFDVMDGIVDQIGQKFEVQQVLKQPSFGQLEIRDEYNVHYKQQADFLGIDRFEVEYSDANGVNSETLPVTVTVYNNIPTVTLAPQQLHWRETKEVDLLATANDDDVEDEVSVKSVGTSFGKFTNPSGDKKTYKYEPNKFVGTDSIAIEYTDGLATVTRPLQFVVTNAVPVPAKITLNQHWRKHRAGIKINVLSGCTDPDSLDECKLDRIDAAPVPSAAGKIEITDKTNGIVELKANDKSMFRNNKATFTYFVTDELATTSNQVEVTITNSIPTGVADTFSFVYEEGKAFVLDVLANDNDADADDVPHLVIKSVTTPVSKALVSVVENGKKIKYSPLPSFLGTDTFKYTITDGIDISAEITVTVKISYPEPTVKNHESSMKWNDDPLDFDLLKDAVGLGIKYTSRTSPMGEVTDENPSSPDGKVTYKPSKSSSIYTATVGGHRVGVDQFSYKVRDQFNREKTGQVSIEIKNKIPVCSSKTETVEKKQSNPQYTYNITSECVDDEPLVIHQIQYTGGSVVQESADKKSIIYRPKAGWSGVDVIKYKAYDGQLESEWATLTINVTNHPPVCEDIEETLVKGSSKQFDVLKLARCTDANGDALTVKLNNPDQSKGTVSLSNNIITWSHKPMRSGEHVFNFEVTDGTASIIRKFTITIPNNRPTAKNVDVVYGKKNNAIYNFPVSSLATDTDANDVLRIISVSSGDCAAIGEYKQYSSSIEFRPHNGAAENCTLTCTVGDSDVDHELTISATIRIQIVDKPPVAVNDFFNTTQGQTIVIKIADILENDKDPDETDTIEFVGLDLSSCSKEGYCHRTPNVVKNEIVWESDPMHCSTDKIDYTIRSSGGETAKATIHLTFTHCTCYAPIDLVFALDGSASISSDNWRDLKKFIRDLSSNLVISPTHVHVGAIQFSKSVRTEFSLNSNKDRVDSNLNGLEQMQGWTNTPGGLEQAEKVLLASSRKDVSKVIVLITDGVSNYPQSCSQCKEFYGSNNADKCSYNGLTCSSCKSSNHYYPCADPLRVSNDINARPKWKIVALGIGSSLTSNGGRGADVVQEIDYAKKLRHVDWKYLNTIVNEIVDSACDQNM